MQPENFDPLSVGLLVRPFGFQRLRDRETERRPAFCLASCGQHSLRRCSLPWPARALTMAAFFRSIGHFAKSCKVACTCTPEATSWSYFMQIRFPFVGPPLIFDFLLISHGSCYSSLTQETQPWGSDPMHVFMYSSPFPPLYSM